MARTWIRLDIGLLDDERFEALTPEQSRAWQTSYLLIARAGDAVKDKAHLARLLTKQGIDDAARLVEELDEAGWFVESTREEGITIRGYEQHQPVYRGPSDDPAVKATRNAKRPTTRAGRGASVERRGASGASVERHSTDSTDSTVRVERESPRSTDATTGLKSLKEALAEHGYDPSKKSADRTS